MRIVVLLPNLLGDAIMATPLLRHLRNSLPEARLSIVLGEHNLAVAPLLGSLVDEVLPYRKKPLALLSLLMRGRRASFDWLLNTTVDRLKVTPLLVRMIGARHVVGLATGHAELYDTAVEGPPHGSIHYSDRLLLLADPMGVPPPADPHTELTLPAEAVTWAEKNWPLPAGGPVVLVNVSGTGAWKFWGVERYVALIAAERRSHPELQFIIAGHPRDQAAIDAIKEQSASPGLPTTSSFAAFAACIARTDFLVSPDTSVVHIASAFRRPVLGFYITVPLGDSCAPYRSPHVLLRSPTGSVDGISLEEGIDGFERLLAQVATQAPAAGVVR